MELTENFVTATAEMEHDNSSRIKALADGTGIPGMVVPIGEDVFDVTRVLCYLEELLKLENMDHIAKRSAAVAVGKKIDEIYAQVHKAKVSSILAPPQGKILSFPPSHSA